MNNFYETLNYIYSLTNFEKDRKDYLPSNGFENVRKVLEILGIDYKKKILFMWQVLKVRAPFLCL